MGNNPEPVSSVWRTKGTSWYNKCLDIVTFSLKIAEDIRQDVPASYVFDDRLSTSEEIGLTLHSNLLTGLYHTDDSSNIFSNDPSGLDLSYRPKHFAPEIAVIIRSSALSGNAEGLTGKTSGKDIDLSSVYLEIGFFDVCITYRIGKLVLQHLALELRPLAVKDIRPSDPFGRKIEATDTAKKRAVSHSISSMALAA